MLRKTNLKKRIVYIVGGSAREETVGAVRGRGLGCVVRTRFNIKPQKKI